MTDPAVAAVGLGASGGRVIACRIGRAGAELHEMTWFGNEPVPAGGTLHWDVLNLFGSVLSGLRAAAAALSGVPGGLPLIAVGSHDTAATVVAVPAAGAHFACISSGTWSLVEMELAKPVLTRESRLAHFTNEAGIDGTVRYLRNVTGLWLLQECLRCWGSPSLDALLAAAADSLDGMRATVCASAGRGSCSRARAPVMPLDASSGGYRPDTDRIEVITIHSVLNRLGV